MVKIENLNEFLKFRFNFFAKNLSSRLRRILKQIFGHKLHKFSQIKARTLFVKGTLKPVCVLICGYIFIIT